MRHRARIVLVCAPGGRACSGRLTLSVQVKRYVRARFRHCKRRRPHCTHAILRVRTVRLAPTSYKLAPGARGKVSVHLGKQAVRLLRDARGRRLAVRAKASVAGGRAAHRRIVLVLRGG